MIKKFMNTACPQLFLSKNFLDEVYQVQAIKKLRTTVGLKQQLNIPSIKNIRYVIQTDIDKKYPKSANYYRIIVMKEGKLQEIMMCGYSVKDYEMANSFAKFFNDNLHKYFNEDLKIIIEDWMKANKLKGF